MASRSKQVGQKVDSDVHITYADQQKINKFARLNAKLEDYKDELKQKQNELRNVEDAAEELELSMEDKVQFQIGEVFLFQDLDSTQKCLEEHKNGIQKQIEEIEVLCSKLKDDMSELKTYLYGTFGNHINLEAEED